jgi:hypothetical protein
MWGALSDEKSGPYFSVFAGRRQHSLSLIWVPRDSWAYFIVSIGARDSVVVKALCYKPEGRRFDTRWGEFLNLSNLSGRSRPGGLVSP